MASPKCLSYADPGDRIETLRARIEGSDEISDDDWEALLAFSDELYLLQTKYSDLRYLKLLRHCTRMAEHVGGLADALEDCEATEAIVRWIDRTYDNEERSTRRSRTSETPSSRSSGRTRLSSTTSNALRTR